MTVDMICDMMTCRVGGKCMGVVCELTEPKFEHTLPGCFWYILDQRIQL